MFTLDIPDMPQHYASVMVAQANQVQVASAAKERAMGLCFPVNYNIPGQEYEGSSLGPENGATIYFGLYEKRTVDRPTSTDVELIVPPKHGKVVYSKYHDGSLQHNYVPDPGYVGSERLVFRVKVNGTTVRLVYLLKITKLGVDTEGVKDVLCKKTGDLWKISLPNPPTDTSTIQSLLSLTTG